MTNFDPLGPSTVRIRRTELRGITVAQLTVLTNFISAHAHLWCETFESSPDFGRPLETSKVNLYQTTAWIIRPATLRAKNSFVELVATSAREQRPQWFVSHAWQEAVVRFVACLRQHAMLRKLTQHTAYWVCAYANNQHRLEETSGRVSDSIFCTFFGFSSPLLFSHYMSYILLVFSFLWFNHSIIVIQFIDDLG